MHFSSKWVLSSVVLGVAGLGSATSNVALGKDVTLHGVFGVLNDPYSWSSLASAAGSTVVDGIFQPEQTQWDFNSVWWDTRYDDSKYNSIEIDLAGLFHVTSLKLQADDNDAYGIDYLAADNTWKTLGYFDVKPSYGLTTRDLWDLQAAGKDVNAKAFKIYEHEPNDGYLAVSEFQAFGESAVPGPAAVLPALLGLGVTALRRRRK